jgi:predicted RNA methylase
MYPTDRDFDQFLPSELRCVSGQYWTPLVVAIRAAEWLDELNVRTVVDIGSGAGKFCVAAALSGRAQLVIGVEQRARLIAAARDLAHVLDVGERVTFIHGTFGETSLPEADAYYLYNPFGENLFGPAEHLDDDVELGDARYQRDIAAVEKLLREARVGTYLLTYNGFGGEVPSSYRQVRVDLEMPNHLRMWRKTKENSLTA